MTAIQFLTRTGKTCTPLRQEFVLLSDVLGVSALVDALNNPPVGAATESSVMGPFFTDDAPFSASDFPHFLTVLRPKFVCCAETSRPTPAQSRSASRSRRRGKASTCTSRGTCVPLAARLSLVRLSRRGRRMTKVSGDMQVPFRSFSTLTRYNLRYFSFKASTILSTRIALSQTAAVGS